MATKTLQRNIHEVLQTTDSELNAFPKKLLKVIFKIWKGCYRL